MEFEIILRGKVCTKDYQKFISGFDQLLKDTDSKFFGQNFIHEFDEAEIIEDEEN